MFLVCGLRNRERKKKVDVWRGAKVRHEYSNHELIFLKIVVEYT